MCHNSWCWSHQKIKPSLHLAEPSATLGLLAAADRPPSPHSEGRFFRSVGSDGAKMWEEIPQKQCCAARSAGAAQYSLQLLDPKRVVQAVAAAGNWRHRRTVSVMASKVQIWFQQNRKKNRFYPRTHIYFHQRLPVLSSIEPNIVGRWLFWRKSDKNTKKTNVWSLWWVCFVIWY